jgi:hypothetical protein
MPGIRCAPVIAMGNEFIHLCQPDAGKSCGACCGLYNYADNSRESLIRRLKDRTELFRQTAGDPEGLARYSETVRGREDPSRIYEVIYCCEYLGFMDPECRRTGCLLHPAGNGGNDRRDVSFYGRELCDGHFCPSYHYLSQEEKIALINIMDDWHLYGLCITDIDLVKEYFRFIGDGICRVPKPDLFRRAPFRDIALRYFRWKLDWPYRTTDPHRFGKYAFGGGHYMIPYIDYEALGCPRSRFDKIFLSLSSEFRDSREVRHAEAMVRENIDAFISACLSEEHN